MWKSLKLSLGRKHAQSVTMKWEWKNIIFQQITWSNESEYEINLLAFSTLISENTKDYRMAISPFQHHQTKIKSTDIVVANLIPVSVILDVYN